MHAPPAIRHMAGWQTGRPAILQRMAGQPAITDHSRTATWQDKPMARHPAKSTGGSAAHTHKHTATIRDISRFEKHGRIARHGRTSRHGKMAGQDGPP